MTRNRLLAALALAALAAFALRGPDAPVPASSAPRAEAPAGARAPLLELAPLGAEEPEGETAPELSYRLTYTSESTVDGNAGPEARVTGLWTVTRLADDRIGVRLRSPTVEGHLALPQAEELTGEVELEAAGALVGMGFPPAMGNSARRLFTSLATATWFTPGDGATWTVEEEDASGTLRADYARSGDQVVRTVAAYEALRGVAGLSAHGADQVTPAGETRFTFDADGLAHLEADVRTTFDMGEGSPRVEVRVRVSLARIKARRVALRAGHLAIGGLSNHLDTGFDRAITDDALVGDATVDELLADVTRIVSLDRAHPDTRKWRSVTLRRLAAAVRLDPMVARDVAADVAAHADDAGRVSLLTGALGSAATPDATNALASLLAADLPAAADRQVLAHLALTEARTPEAARALQAELDGPQGDTAAAALGSQARGLGAQDTDEATDFVDALIERYQAARTPAEAIAAVQALGNSGSPRALPWLAGLVVADDPALAMAAVFALRFLPGADVDATLDAITRTGDHRSVTAIQAIGFRDAALWSPRLEALRAQFAEVETLTSAIDTVLSAWQGA